MRFYKILNLNTNLIGGIDNGVAYVTPNTPTETNTLAAIPIVTGFSSMLYFNQYTESKFITTANSSYEQTGNNSINFWLTSSSGIPVNLGGNFFTVKIMVRY